MKCREQRRKLEKARGVQALCRRRLIHQSGDDRADEKQGGTAASHVQVGGRLGDPRHDLRNRRRSRERKARGAHAGGPSGGRTEQWRRREPAGRAWPGGLAGLPLQSAVTGLRNGLLL